MKWFDKSKRLRIWTANSGAKQLLKSPCEGNKVGIFITTETLDEMANKNPDTYLLEVETIRNALRSQHYYCDCGDFVRFACSYLEKGEARCATIVAEKGEGEFILSHIELGSWNKPYNLEWKSFKYTSRKIWRESKRSV